MEEPKTGGNAWPELPMPRDSHLLAPWTQQLLREARRPRLAKRTQEFVEVDKGEEEEEGERDITQTGFTAKRWSQLLTHLEEPEREYLAKRRKGLPSLHAFQTIAAIASNAPTRKTKVIKADADGNTTIYEVLVPEGQKVEGEVTEDVAMPDILPEKAAPGTIIEGVGIANAEGLIVAHDLLAPVRRRNIPPKRVKKGGPGRGRKKVMFQRSDAHDRAAATSDGIKSTGQGASMDPMDVDTPTRGEDEDAHGQIGQGEEDDGDEGDEGDEGDDDDDREEGEISEGETSSMPEKSTMPPSQLELPMDFSEPLAAEPSPSDTGDTKAADLTMQPSSVLPTSEISDEATYATAPTSDSLPPPLVKERDPSSSPDMPLAGSSHSRQGSFGEPAAALQTNTTSPPPADVKGLDLLRKFEQDLDEHERDALMESEPQDS